MHYNRIIIFCDYGLDDAVATLHILSHADMFDAIDVVPIGGNVPVGTAYRNAQSLLAAAEEEGLPCSSKLRIVDTRAVKQPRADIPDVHGVDGIGDILTHRNSDLPVVPIGEYIKQLAKKKDSPHDCVLSLGPCTLPRLIGYVPFCTVLMGGATNEPPNYGDYEFNEALDPESFAVFAKRAAAVATLDTCHSDKLDFNIDHGGKLINKLAERCLTLCKNRNCKPVIYDLVAALAVTHPERFDAAHVKRADSVEYDELIYN